MRRAVLLPLATALWPAAALAGTGDGAETGALTCQFQSICTGKEPCTDAPEDAVLTLALGPEAAQVTIEGETDSFKRINGATSDPQIFIGHDPADDAAAALVSLYAGGEILMTMHGDLFGPFAVTAIGTCSRNQEGN